MVNLYLFMHKAKMAEHERKAMRFEGLREFSTSIQPMNKRNRRQR